MDFSLENHPTCHWAELLYYDGPSELETTPRIYCFEYEGDGHEWPNLPRSTGNVVVLRFSTTGFAPKRGFWIDYRGVTCTYVSKHRT